MHLLVVDDESDILDMLTEELGMCLVDTASDYQTALQYIQNYTYDIVILDIMGVNGFQLLRDSVSKGFPTVILTAHAFSPESLKKSIKLGAVSYLPKESIPQIKLFLEDVVIGGGKPAWKKLFSQLGGYFTKKFGPDWKERDKFLKEFVEELQAT